MNRIVLFDGVCNFCNSSVQFIINRDPEGKFQFASLQSRIGQKLVENHKMPADLSSFVLIEGDRAYSKSSAALRVVRQLSGLWPLLSVFLLVPRPLRDPFYNLIAKNRYKWFGKRDSCMIPPPHIKKRFLHD